MNTKIMESIRKYGKRAKGKKELIKHLLGQKLSLRQAIYAHCYDCLGYYADGVTDCEMTACSLHPFMPYNKSKIKLSNRILTKEHKEKLIKARRHGNNKEF